MNRDLKTDLRRKRVLNYLNTYGTSTLLEIIAATAFSRTACRGYLKDLIFTEEVVITYRGNNSITRYFTLADVSTYSTPNVLATNNISQEPWRIVHKGTMGAHPIPDQGGQGKKVIFRGISSLGYTA